MDTQKSVDDVVGVEKTPAKNYGDMSLVRMVFLFILAVGAGLGALMTSRMNISQSRAATIACKLDVTTGECLDTTGLVNNMGNTNVGADAVTNTLLSTSSPRCAAPVYLTITYNRADCLAGHTCDNLQKITSVGWYNGKPLKNYADGTMIPLTNANGYWIHDARNYRSSPLINGLSVSRIGDGRFIISHADSMVDKSQWKGQFQSIDATMILAGATTKSFVNGDQGWALDQPWMIDPSTGKKAYFSHYVDVQGDGRWSVPPTFKVDQNGNDMGTRVMTDEIVYTLGKASWKQHTRITFPGDDYVMTATCPQFVPSPTPQPLDISVVIDRSSTMNELESGNKKKLVWAKEAVAAFAEKFRGSSVPTWFSVESFGAQGNATDTVFGTPGLAGDSSYNSSLNLKLTGPNQIDAAVSAINGVNYIHAGTCIQCGLIIANKQLVNNGARRVVVLLSDGQANHTWTGTTAYINGVSNTKAAINAANDGRTMGIEYRVVGYGLTSKGQIDESTLRQIAGCSATDTSCPNYQYKPDVITWKDAFQKIASELLAQ